MFLFPLLMTLPLTRCRDIDGTLIADALMAGRPQLLRLELWNTKINWIASVGTLIGPLFKHIIPSYPI